MADHVAEVEVEGVSKRYAGVEALRAVSLHVPRGQRHALIGPNGAGKSTLFHVIAGTIHPTSGRVRLKGQDVIGWPPDRIARLGISRTFQQSALFGEETLLDACLLAAHATAARSRPWHRLGSDPDLVAAAHAALGVVGLADHAGRTAGSLSHGDARQLEVAMALAQRPTVLLADEPLAGLAETERLVIGQLLHELPRDLTVLFIEHDLRFAMGLADVVTVLDLGRVVASGTPAEVRASDEVARIYVGDAAHASPTPVPPPMTAPRPPLRRPDAALRVADLSAGYGGAQVLRGISLSVPERQVLAILGRNGMGKSTLLGALMGTVSATGGTVCLGEMDLTGTSTTQRARAGLALVAQGHAILPGLSVEEQLTVGLRSGDWTLASVYELFPILRNRRRQEGTTLSGGEQQMLAIARALLRNPRVMLLDEPSEGLAAPLVEHLREVIAILAASGQTIVLAEQNVPFALAVSDEVVVLDRGQIVHRGSSSDLHASHTLQRELMGV